MLKVTLFTFVPNKSSCNSGTVTQDWTPSKNNKDVTQDRTLSAKRTLTRIGTPSKNNKETDNSGVRHHLHKEEFLKLSVINCFTNDPGWDIILINEKTLGVV